MFSPETADRLAKLIPRLASDQDGEVVATARAIERTLKADGSDLHGLADAVRRKKRIVLNPTGHGGGSFSYADTFKEAASTVDGPPHPDALTNKFGLPIHAPDRIVPWPEVAKHCLMLNRTVPKKYGGKFLQDWQKQLLKTLIDDLRQPTNRHVQWIETVVARCHQGRDAAHKARSSDKGTP